MHNKIQKSLILAGLLAVAGASTSVAVAASGDGSSESPNAVTAAVVNGPAGKFLRETSTRKGLTVEGTMAIKTAVGDVVVADTAQNPPAKIDTTSVGIAAASTCLSVALHGGGGAVACRPEGTSGQPLTSVNLIRPGQYSVVAYLPAGSSAARIVYADRAGSQELRIQNSVVAAELSKTQVGVLEYTDGDGVSQSLQLAAATSGD